MLFFLFRTVKRIYHQNMISYETRTAMLTRPNITQPPLKFFWSKANIALFDIAIRLTRVAFFFRFVFAEEQTRHASKCCVTSVTLPMVRRGTWVILAPWSCVNIFSESVLHETARVDLPLQDTMSETLTRVSIGYKKYKTFLRIIGAVIGILLGIAGCVAFAAIYHNYNAASWAGVSAIFASIFLHFTVAVYRDVNRHFSVAKFTIFVNIGLGGMISGIIGFIINIAFGIARHETG